MLLFFIFVLCFFLCLFTFFPFSQKNKNILNYEEKEIVAHALPSLATSFSDMTKKELKSLSSSSSSSSKTPILGLFGEALMDSIPLLSQHITEYSFFFSFVFISFLSLFPFSPFLFPFLSSKKKNLFGIFLLTPFLPLSLFSLSLLQRIYCHCCHPCWFLPFQRCPNSSGFLLLFVILSFN